MQRAPMRVPEHSVTLASRRVSAPTYDALADDAVRDRRGSAAPMTAPAPMTAKAPDLRQSASTCAAGSHQCAWRRMPGVSCGVRVQQGCDAREGRMGIAMHQRRGGTLVRQCRLEHDSAQAGSPQRVAIGRAGDKADRTRSACQRSDGIDARLRIAAQLAAEPDRQLPQRPRHCRSRRTSDGALLRASRAGFGAAGAAAGAPARRLCSAVRMLAVMSSGLVA